VRIRGTCQVITISEHHRIGLLTNSSLRCQHSVYGTENLLGGEVVSDFAFGSDYEPNSQIRACRPASKNRGKSIGRLQHQQRTVLRTGEYAVRHMTALDRDDDLGVSQAFDDPLQPIDLNIQN